MGAADRDLGKGDLAAAQASARRLGDDIAGVDLDRGPEALHRHQQEIDRTRADGAAAGQRHPRLAAARQQRRQNPETRAHARHQLIRGGGVDDLARGHVDGLAGIRVFALAASVDRIIDAMIGQDAHQQAHVGEPRQVFQRDRAIGQQRGDHQRQGRVLGPGNRNDAIQRFAADDSDAIHCSSLGAATRGAFCLRRCFNCPAEPPSPPALRWRVWSLRRRRLARKASASRCCSASLAGETASGAFFGAVLASGSVDLSFMSRGSMRERRGEQAFREVLRQIAGGGETGACHDGFAMAETARLSEPKRRWRNQLR